VGTSLENRRSGRKSQCEPPRGCRFRREREGSNVLKRLRFQRSVKKDDGVDLEKRNPSTMSQKKSVRWGKRKGKEKKSCFS